MTQDDSSVPKAVLDRFENGKSFTKDLLEDNENLRMVIAQKETEIRDMKNQFASVEIDELRNKIDMQVEEIHRLKEDNLFLRSRFADVKQKNMEFKDRHSVIEKQNSDLISLYTASHMLHETLDYDTVVASLREIVINIVGSECFGIFFIDNAGKDMTLIAEEGLERVSTVPGVINEGRIHQTASEGTIFVADDEDLHIELPSKEPIACIPMKVGDETLGVVAIYSLLIQKREFEPLDGDLFLLLATHAATALYSARLFSDLKRSKRGSKGVFGSLENEDDQEEAAY